MIHINKKQKKCLDLTLLRQGENFNKYWTDNLLKTVIFIDSEILWCELIFDSYQ